ncbi:MAG: hypothetical protein KJO85_07275 [Gammaproteobacteria bacterium]|nr:hypothetical protein [Gammaproteobacteria bacterium]NNE05610.1 hypothetical protein [Xanthomonadales bacterium]
MIKTIYLVLLLCLSTVASAITPDEQSLLHKTAMFAFYSDFATNLHDALLISGGMDSRERSDWFAAGEQLACFEGLPNSMRSGWEMAVGFYARVIAPSSWGDRQQSLIRLDLAGISEGRDESGRAFNQMTRHVRAVAAPAYRACLWEAQDAANRAWVNTLMPQLERHESVIAARLATLYGSEWHGLPLRVDIVADAPPLGANSIFLVPEGGHLLVSTRVADEDALEITFHEASHTIVSAWRKDPLPIAINETADQLGMQRAGDLWHVMLFYLTGAAVQEALAKPGEGTYVPYMLRHDLWAGRWGQYREALETHLPGYLEGKTTLERVVHSILEDLNQ